MAPQFSSDGKYFALLSVEGKLKIWNTLTNKLEQEFVPNYHLSCPCTCLHFVENQSAQNKGVSPKKKKRRDSGQTNALYVALGTSAGLLLGYSIASASVAFNLNSNTNKNISCLSWDSGQLMYAGIDHSVYIFNLQEQNIKDKWKCGNIKINAIKVIPKGRLLTASKSVKLWDIKNKEVLKSFTGHSSDVCIMEYIRLQHNSVDYFITGSKNDRLLSCWTLSSQNDDSDAVATFLMDDSADSVTVFQSETETTSFAALTRGGSVYFYQHILNGKSKGPLKPKTVIQVASNSTENSKDVMPVPIIGITFLEELTVTLCYGSHIRLTFENVVVKLNEKVQCLVRSEKTLQKIDTEPGLTKVRQPMVNTNIQYLTPQFMPSSSGVKRKPDEKCEVPMEQRLENLMLTKSDSKVPKATNLSQLLIQGIHSKDKNILRTVLTKQDDGIVKSTIKRIPITAIVPLLQELTEFVQGKTLSCSIAALWIKNILEIHSGILLSNPKLPELLAPILRSIEYRLLLQIPLNRLHGRLDLLMSQVNSKNSPEEDNTDEHILSYIDKDSSDSEVDYMETTQQSSENDWSEEESEEENQNNDVSISDNEEDIST